MQDPIADTFKIVCFNDHYSEKAFDLAPPEVAAYRKTRDLDAILPKLRPEAQPTYFHVARIPAAAITSWLELPRALREQMAFKAACHFVQRPDAPPLQVDRMKVEAWANGAQVAPDEWFNDVARKYGMETCLEVGRVALAFSCLPEGAKGPFA